MQNIEDEYIGKKFNKLTPIKRLENAKDRTRRYLCECDCGNENLIAVKLTNLKSGNTKSCGCLRKSNTSKIFKKYNTYDLSGEYGIGYTEDGKEFWFDLEDYDKIKDYYWSFENEYVVCINEGLRLHRLVMGAKDNEEVDHIRHETYDNRKFKLRRCSSMKNLWNRGLYKNNTSGVTGVSWHVDNGKWLARITVNEEIIHLGYFNNFDEAVKTRKEAEEKYFGEWSYDNSMKTIEENSINKDI